jgi:hypothetical protein
MPIPFSSCAILLMPVWLRALRNEMKIIDRLRITFSIDRAILSRFVYSGCLFRQVFVHTLIHQSNHARKEGDGNTITSTPTTHSPHPSALPSTGLSLMTGGGKLRRRRRRLLFAANPSQDHPSACARPGWRCSKAGQGNTDGAATVNTAPKKVARKSDETRR